MRIAVMGTGALGGFFGGLLARAGEDVVFIARGAHLAAIRDRGLTVKSERVGDFALPVWATDDPREVGSVDLVLFGVKTYDLEAAAEQMRPLLGPETVMLPVQNGVDIAERIGRVIGSEHVLGGLTWVGGKIEAPGVITQNASSGSTMLQFGELAVGASRRAEQLLDPFERAGITAELHPNVRVPLWRKFVGVCANGGMTALTRLPLGPILACSESRAMYLGAMEEVARWREPAGLSCRTRWWTKRSPS
ncbi:MAG: 2-dehydropantoate 2-reductase [Chloroflexota bacterium]|nr:2-dehydropantoate 2-reductase [Chloroflexota bacterium]